jgi:hypothetical protein
MGFWNTKPISIGNLNAHWVVLILENGGKRAELFSRYPISDLILYDGVTVLHYLFGGLGITLAYSFVRWSFMLGAVYLLFALFQMYVLMPLMVCPSCVYHRMEDGRCISGLNRISRRSAKEKPLQAFPNRSKGILSPNNLYMASLILPILAIIPGLIIDFSFILLGILLGVVILLLFRFFVIFPRIACIHCSAKFRCPNAEKMGVRDK